MANTSSCRKREEIERILKTASEKDRRPMRKLDALDARLIVREKRKGAGDGTIADTLKACTGQAQRAWSRFRRLGTGRILYLPKRPGRHRKGEPGRRWHSATRPAISS